MSAEVADTYWSNVVVRALELARWLWRPAGTLPTPPGPPSYATIAIAYS